MDRDVFEAAELGNLSPIQGLKEDEIVNQVTHQMNSVLHIAVRFKQEEILKQVVSKCPLLLLKENAVGDTPLHIAARIGSLEMAQLLIGCAEEVVRDVERQPIETEMEVEAMLSKKNFVKEDTALHVAVRNGHFDVVEFLIAENLKLLDMVNRAKVSPLFLAVEGGFFDIAKHIIEKPPYLLTHSLPHCGGSNGMNALHAAVIRTHHGRVLEHHVPDLSLEHLRRLIRSFVLHAEEWIQRPQKPEIDIMRLLVERRPDLVEEKDIFEWTPLHCAAHLGHLKATQLLLEHCSSAAYLKDKEGFSALHIAANEGHVKVMEEIIRQKPDVCDLVDNRGWTALHVAIANKRLNVVKYILKTPKLEFLLNVADIEGNMPLHLAAGRKNYRIIKLLVDDDRVNKRATNLKYLKPIDIIRTNPYMGELYKSWLAKNLERQGGHGSLEFIVHRTDEYGNPTGNNKEVDNIGQTGKDEHEKHLQFRHSTTAKQPKMEETNLVHKDKAIKSHRLKKISDTHLLVAALIATVTFTAAFTIPGGYENDDPEKGMAILSRKGHFKVFIIADSIAFYCSTASVLLQFFSSVELNYHLLLRFMRIAAALTYISIFGMVVAFTFGLRVVMPSSSKLANYTLAMGGCCVFLFIIGCI